MHKVTFSIKLSAYLVAIIGLKQAVGHLCCYIIYLYMGIYVVIMHVFSTTNLFLCNDLLNIYDVFISLKFCNNYVCVLVHGYL